MGEKLEGLKQAFALVDYLAGEGVIYHHDDGSCLAADVVASELCQSLGIECDEAWPAQAASRLTATPDRSDDALAEERLGEAMQHLANVLFSDPGWKEQECRKAAREWWHAQDRATLKGHGL